jgi:type IV secretory pathway ATPase VirB11/archaellum biosynthesis ATPase
MSFGEVLPESLRSVFARTEQTDDCGCDPHFDDETLLVDATDCEHDGRLADSPACRERVVRTLADRDASAVRVESGGVVRAYEGDRAALLVAAGRFVETMQFHDERLASRAARDPLGAAREATGRADAARRVAAETGLSELAAAAEGYDTALAPAVGPTVSHWRVTTTPPPESELWDVRDLDTGATVRRYEPETGVDRYYLSPVERSFADAELALLATAYDRLADGEFTGEQRAPGRAVRAVHEANQYPETVSIETVTAVLRKHTRGFGLLEDLFADSAVSDVFVTPPAPDNWLRVTADGTSYRTNVRLTEAGIAALSSRFRRESGRAFSRADPTLDATATVADRQVRVAGVTAPPSDGTGFAFRAQDDAVWTVPALVGNETLSPAAAALLSVAVERGAATLVAGPRGAGKTTLLGALLWELPPAVRTVAIEDTPELPVEQLQDAGRDIQQLRAGGGGEFSPTEALRTALRLGDGAIVVGEVRGSEASVLYEAMRVGANSEAVLGTIHGDGAAAVYERVVEDLGVSPSSFGVTDLVVTCDLTADGTRRVAAIEEVCGSPDPQFEPLFERGDGGLESTGRIERGNSRTIDGLRAAGETYASVRDQHQQRTQLLESLADRDATDPGAIVESHTDRA